jgi:DNA helicase-2/ATP-dependent DNA helicase PcrA
MQNNLIARLNPEQREAVLTVDAPLLIVAGAGSGKTNVITHKIAFLIKEKKFSPSQIIGVTFTNRAAREMKERIQLLTGMSANLFPISTFHSLGLRILRESGKILGFDNSWQVIDDRDQKKIIERIARENIKHYSSDFTEACRRKLNLSKMNLCYPNDKESLYRMDFQDDDVLLFFLYHEYMQKNKIWDYEDLVSFSVNLLQNNSGTRDLYGSRFRYMVVDEFQDTNPNQYELIKLLAGQHKNITAVGDDDQAVYSWRGASIRFLFEFERDFPGTKIIKLEQNYRSTQPILNFSNHIIQRNLFRRRKSMWTEKKAGKNVFLFHSVSKDDEAKKIAEFIMQLRSKHNEFFPMAILYRINSQSLAFEVEFLKKKIPFKIVKGMRFFERREVKNSIALLKMAIDPNDDVSFLRMVEFLPLGIGPKTIETLLKISREKLLSLFMTLKEFFKEKYGTGKLFAKIDSLYKNQKNFHFSEMLRLLLDDSNYLNILEEKSEHDRILNIKELLSFIEKWETDNSGANFVDLMDAITLNALEKNLKTDNLVYLMTMHNAKGTEFPTVIVAGINATYMPFFLRKGPDELEEERRLFYVGCTRAIENLIISTGSQQISKFLAEMDGTLFNSVENSDELIYHLKPIRPSRKAISPDRYLEHPVLGRGKIIRELGNKTFLIEFIGKGEVLIDTSIINVHFCPDGVDV